MAEIKEPGPGRSLTARTARDSKTAPKPNGRETSRLHDNATGMRAGAKNIGSAASGKPGRFLPVAVVCDLPVSSPISDTERKLFAIYFSEMITRILVEPK